MEFDKLKSCPLPLSALSSHTPSFALYLPSCAAMGFGAEIPQIDVLPIVGGAPPSHRQSLVTSTTDTHPGSQKKTPSRHSLPLKRAAAPRRHLRQAIKKKKRLRPLTSIAHFLLRVLDGHLSERPRKPGAQGKPWLKCGLSSCQRPSC